MAQITDVMEGLRIARQYGATSIEAEHDEIFVTLKEAMPESYVRTMGTLGWVQVDEDELWYRRYV